MPDHHQEIPPGAIIITPEVAYATLNESVGQIKGTVQRLERDMSSIPATVAEHDALLNQIREAGLPGRFVKVESDVNELKRRWAWMAGMGAAAAFVAGIIGALIPLLLG